MTVDYERLTAAVIRLQNGEGKAFEEIYNLTNGPAYFTALKIAKNEDDAQDVLQDSYVKVLDKIGELEKPESFMSWFNIDNAEKLNGSVRRIGIGAAEEPESGELVFVIHTVSSDVRPGDIFGQLRERIEYRNDTALDNQIDGITDTITDIQALEERVADIPVIGDILLYDFNTDAFEKRSAERFDRFLERLDNILLR